MPAALSAAEGTVSRASPGHLVWERNEVEDRILCSEATLRAGFADTVSAWRGGPNTVGKPFGLSGLSYPA